MVSVSPFIHQSDRVERRASDVSATDWRYQTHVENYPNFRRVLLGLFSGPGNPCNSSESYTMKAAKGVDGRKMFPFSECKNCILSLTLLELIKTNLSYLFTFLALVIVSLYHNIS